MEAGIQFNPWKSQRHLLNFCRLYANPLLFLVGLRYTGDAAYAAALQPSIPVITFVLAAIVGYGYHIITLNLIANSGFDVHCLTLSLTCTHCFATNLGVDAAFISVEAINIFTKDGILRVLGTVVCVSGAILMALCRGPSLTGLGGTNAANGIVTPGTWSSSTPYPAQRLTSTMLEYGVETWHLGVLCLIGNCLMASAYLVIQVMQISELALNPSLSLVGF